MKRELKNKLIEIAKSRISTKDPSHDFSHSWRVLQNALNIAKVEKADLDIIIPAALFHDIKTFPKDKEKNKRHYEYSAIEAEKILKKIPEFPREKLNEVLYAIKNHGSRVPLKTLEANIIRDADNLEITGAIIVMRMFSTAGVKGRAFYDLENPFGKSRKLDGQKYTLDYYTERLLEVENEVFTITAKKIAVRRTKFLKNFMKELKLELLGK